MLDRLGSFLLVIGTAIASNIVCGPGKYVNVSAVKIGASDMCALCPPGMAKNTVDNSTRCEQCPRNSYQWREGMDVCYGCPQSSSTNDVGNENGWDCVCEDGKYIALIDGAWRCETCPAGMECRAGGDKGELAPQPGETWEREGEFGAGRLALRSCPTGYLLVNDTHNTQRCSLCPLGTYSTYDLDGCPEPEKGCPYRSCLSCPAGAVCLGQSFVTGTNGEAWKAVETSDGYQQLRLETCASEYVLVRSDAAPLLDECVLCDGLAPCQRCAPSWQDQAMTADSPLFAQQICTKCSGCPDEDQEALPGSAPPARASLAAVAVLASSLLCLSLW
eukprot:CAMPEP_0196724190 /NCGR_PEP_ID=MMETSP1091-20130531/6150_1 /TAXON_ID=302021 /ORGANISM="Rhodomonas sp., Strain CCMP768" /LENGTH=331 /DNA_ID=CAMNT_0042066289 /DNA_START=18 /DNA_END=1013 /DNA_ORIENTATION=+